MIENKELGVKFAESEEEAKWYEFNDSIKQNITLLQNRIKRTQADLKVPSREIILKFRNGAKAAIKNMQLELDLQREILEFSEKKLIKKV